MTEQRLADEILKHSLQILRLSAGEEAKADAILEELSRELKLLAQSVDLPAARKAEIDALIKQADEAIGTAYLRVGASTDTHALAVVVAEHTQRVIEEAIPAIVRMPSQALLLSLGKDVLIGGAPSSAWWARQSEDMQFRFAAQVRQGIVNGETQERIVQRIVGRRGEPGIMETARSHARTLVHSSVMTAANRARLETFRKNSRLIKGVRWLATLDSRTCRTCMALDGQAWNLDGEKLKGTSVTFRLPPAHWSCRCVASPIPKSFKDIGLDIPEPDAGERASSLGPVHGSTTFDDFLKRQPPEFVDATLGKERAAMFRAGKLTVRDLVSGTGRELTLDQLRNH